MLVLRVEAYPTMPQCQPQGKAPLFSNFCSRAPRLPAPDSVAWQEASGPPKPSALPAALHTGSVGSQTCVCERSRPPGFLQAVRGCCEQFQSQVRGAVPLSQARRHLLTCVCVAGGRGAVSKTDWTFPTFTFSFQSSENRLWEWMWMVCGGGSRTCPPVA